MTRDPAPHERPETPEERLRALLGDGLDGQPPTPAEEAAAALTAHALGELPPDEAAAIERRLADEASATDRAALAETRALAEALRRSAPRQSLPRQPVGSATLRTAVTAALAARGDDKQPSRPRPAPARSWPVLPLLVATGGGAAAVLALVVALDRREDPAPASAPLGGTAVAVADRRGPPLTEAPVAAGPVAAAPEAAAPEAGEVAASASAKTSDALAAKRVEVAAAAPAATQGQLDGEKVQSPRVYRLGERMLASNSSIPRDESGERPLEDLRTLEGDLLAGLPGAESTALPAEPAPSAVAGGGRPAIPPPGAASSNAPESAKGKVRSMAPGRMAGAMSPPMGMAPQGRLDRGGDAGRSVPAMQSGGAAPDVADRFAFGARAAPRSGDEQEERKKWFRERDLAGRSLDRTAPGSERYARFDENPFRNPDEDDQALSTFSIDVDTASYALVRRFIHDRRLPPPDAVRLEEMLNYFRYDDPAPAGDDPLAVRLESAACPWQPGHRLLRVALKGRDIAAAARPGTSLVFLVDVSGSMNEPDKLPLVKQSLSMLVDQLTENDTVAIVTYAGEAGVRLAPTSGDQKARIRDAVESLAAGGSTNGSAGIEVAYRLAQEAFVQGGSNRVILATDGDLNVGITDDAALVGLIKEKAGSGVFLTVLGFGRGNLQDEKMEKLADNGNGIYAYVDGAREARKVLVEQLTGSTLTIAKDVKIQIEFNPARVAAYRLLGYENRLLAARDFKDDTKDAGDVGAGHGVTALYEIVPTDEAGKAAADEPLKYRPARAKRKPEPEAGPSSPEVCTVKLRWKAPEASESVLREVPFEDPGRSFEEASADLRFAAAVVEFGMLLRDSLHRGRASLGHVTATAAGALGHDPGGLRAEFLDLVREAGALLPHDGRAVPN